MAAAKSGAIMLALVIAVTGCTVGPDFEKPAAPSVQSYGREPLAADALGDDQHVVADMDIPAEWWTVFQSAALNQLVQQALAANPGIDAARAALRQSHEILSAEWTNYLPVLQGGLDANRNKNATASLSNPTSESQSASYYSLYTADLSLSFVPDVFGATARAVESARAQAENARFELAAAQISLSSNVVITAVAEASLRAQIAATHRMITLQQDLTETIRRQKQIGTASQLDLLTQQNAEAQTEASLPPLEKQLAQTRDALTALAGLLPNDEPAQQFHLQDFTLPRALPLSLPSALVEQRPDVRAAEAQMHAASAQVGVAVAAMLPQFSITGTLGSTGLKAGQLLTPNYGFWSLGTSLSQTLFDAGALLHKRRAADAALDQAGALYRLAVITAFQNVADCLRALQSDVATVKAAELSASASAATLDLTRQQFKLGTVSNLALLAAEQSYLQSQLTLVQAQANRLADSAGLFQALGGGWWHEGE